MAIKNKMEVAECTMYESPVKIWEKIKDIKLEIFALPNQKVFTYFKPVPIEPSKLYLSYSVPAALPSLEDALKVLDTEYEIGVSDRFVTIQQKREK